MTLNEPMAGIVRETQRRMMVRHDEWRTADDQQATDILFGVMDDVVPHGALLWGMFTQRPELGRLPGPQSVADTAEEVVRDVVKEAVEGTLTEWLDAMWVADNPDEEDERPDPGLT